MAGPLPTWLAKIVIFIVFVGAGIAGFFLGNPVQKSRASQDEVCRVRCADLHKFHRLVPASQSVPGAPAGYDGPWSCECY
ncbi:MAG TPA: hypothetical protein VKS43_08270 [Burkholderiales bacterium]|nr:hypothetical protein [Burkholderiales bacterium]